MNKSPAISSYSNIIMQNIISVQRPEQTIFTLYERAEDKDAFALALIACLILRDKQWQARAKCRELGVEV